VYSDIEFAIELKLWLMLVLVLMLMLELQPVLGQLLELKLKLTFMRPLLKNFTPFKLPIELNLLHFWLFAFDSQPLIASAHLPNHHLVVHALASNSLVYSMVSIYP
jgi:hypothetical protein